MDFDTALQGCLNGLAGSSALLDTSMKVAARDLIYIGAFVLVALIWWPDDRRLNRLSVIAAVASIVLALAIAEVVRQLIYEPRPFVSNSTTALLISHAPDSSFPSDHATVAFALAGGLIWTRRLIGSLWLALAGVIAISRVYVGVHWPVDVLGGALIGLASGTVVTQLARAWARSHATSWFRSDARRASLEVRTGQASGP